ncbi:MAG: hypothetical protein ABSC42_08475 [Tepidisphaeraceae bacterium]|jgi:hypothetical protein
MPTGEQIPVDTNVSPETIQKRFAELTNQREQAIYSWFRYLVGLASGALAILVALGTGLPTPKANMFHRIAMVALGLSILLGSIRLYAEIWFARGHLNNAIKQMKQASATGTISVETLAVKPIPFSATCERLCHLCLVVALVSLMILAWTPPVPH